MPWAVRPRCAAVMTVRPSPEPRSIKRSLGVTLAMSSILSTSVCGVGTQMTSLPSWPTLGTYSFCSAGCAAAGAVWAWAPKAQARASAIACARSARRKRGAEPAPAKRD
ncbi:hypothetical protein D9M69_729200 [compost metagenome]